MVIMRTIGGEVEKMEINPQHIKTYLRAGWVEVKEFQEYKEVTPLELPESTEQPKKMGRPKKQA